MVMDRGEPSVNAEDLAAEARRNVTRLEQELAVEKAFLAELESRAARLRTRPATLSGTTTGRGHTNGEVTPAPARRSRSDKRDMVRAILSERPGRWSVRQMRDALAERGIDPEAGTPVKNILWQLSKEGAVTGHGSGEYEFPARERESESTAQGELTT